MARRTRASGFTLLEVLVAMAVLTLGSVGVLSLTRYGMHMNETARMTTRAVAIAQDLLDQMQTWDYLNDPRLADSNAANNPDFADTAGAFERTVTANLYDHEEAELEAGVWNGISTATASGLGMTRYWNVAALDHDTNGAVTGVRVAAIVRWEQNGTGNRVVLVTFIKNPSVTN